MKTHISIHNEGGVNYNDNQIYFGAMRDKNPHGIGVIVGNDQSFCAGQFENGQFNCGFLVNSDKIKIGQFKGKSFTDGITFSEGVLQIGSFNSNGLSKGIFSDANQLNIGTFEQNKLSGFGASMEISLKNQ